MPTLYLIDGYAQFFRAYHAIRTPMTSPVTKEPTNMSFGFLGMLLKLLRGEGQRMAEWGGRPDYVAVALDVSGDRGTFRSQLYPEYKANRSAPPEDLGPQVDRCLATLREIGVPVIGAEGYEADDVIATVVTRLNAERPDLNIRMISKDKDLKQLLRAAPAGDGGSGAGVAGGRDGGGAVELFDIHTDVKVGPAELHEQLGITPAQVVDMLTLMGDTVDNVPGVVGVGEKTAAQLIREFGTLDALRAGAAGIKGKRGENLRAATATMDMARQLVTLRRDVPVEFDLETARVTRFGVGKLIGVLKELGFNRYQEEVRALIAAGVGDGARGAADLEAHVAAGDGRAPVAAEGGAAGGLWGTGERSATAGTASTAARGAGRARAGGGATREADGLFAGMAWGATGEAAVSDDGEPSGAGEGGGVAPLPRGKIVEGEYICVTSAEQLGEISAEMRGAGVVALDVETTGVSPLQSALCGISLCTKAGRAWYVPVRSPDCGRHLDEAAVVQALRTVLEDATVPKAGHNLKFDMLVLRAAGVRVRGIEAPGAEGLAGDSMVASYLIDSSRSSHGLEALGLATLGYTKSSITELIGTGKAQKTFDTVALERAVPYAAGDADLSLRLLSALTPQLRAMGLEKLFFELEMPLVEVLAELEWNGIRVDAAELERQRGALQQRIGGILDELDNEARGTLGRTFDPDSPKQLAAALFNKPTDAEAGLGIKPIKRTKTGYSTDAEVLEKLGEDETLKTPIPRLILEYRQLSKLVNTYLVALKEQINPRTGRVHASFNQTVAATGRLSSSDPNLQNIPIRTDVGREIRRAFVAEPGNLLVTADYSQIELRLLAHLSRDPALIEAFLRGDDIHTAVAAQIHGVALDAVTKEQRNSAKMVNFGIVYGVTAYGLARRLGIETERAQEIITEYKKRFSGITTFLQECVEQARRYGYVETMLKRRRIITDIDSTNPSRRALGERTAINSVVQGSAADLIKLAMVDLFRAFNEDPARRGEHAGLKARMLLQIHDELVFECPAEHAERVAGIVAERMEGAMRLSVPLKVDAHIAGNWYDGK